MKSDSFLLSKRMISEKVSLYKNKKFTLEFKFKHLNFYNEIYYLRKIKIFDLMLSWSIHSLYFDNRSNVILVYSCYLF